MHQVIGATGRAGSGKDTVCAMAAKLLREQGLSVEIIAFADPLKDVCMRILGPALGIHPDVFYGGQLHKNTSIPAAPDWTGRKVMQWVGTECFRHIHPDIWGLYLANKTRTLFEEGVQVVLVSDVRFLSEARTVKNLGGTVVRVNRPVVQTIGTQGFDNHASETEMNLISADYVIDNENRSLDELELLVKRLLCELHFLPSTQKPRV